MIDTFDSKSRIHDKTIIGPAAWTVASIGGKREVTLALTQPQIAAIAAILEKNRHLPLEQFTKENCFSAELRPFLERVRHEIMDGTGVVVVSGVTRETFPEHEFERIFWLFGIHFGTPAVQSRAKDRIGHVRHEVDNPKNRGYMSTRELGFHSDAFEILGLMCVEGASAGGETQIVSGLSIHNELLKTQPHVLPALYAGYPYATAESADTETPVTSYTVPVFSSVGETMSTMCIGAYMRAAARKLDVPFPEELNEALAAFYAMCSRKDLMLEFMLEPGEMLFLNNFTTLHSRTEFSNSAERQRHLLRLWLNVENGRPVVPALLARGADYERMCLHPQRDAALSGVMK